MKNIQFTSRPKAARAAAAGMLSLGIAATGAFSATAASAQEAPHGQGRVSSSYTSSPFSLLQKTAPTSSTSTTTTSSTSTAAPTASSTSSSTSTTATPAATTSAVLGQSAATGAYGTPNASLVSTLNLQLPITGASISSGFGPRTFNGVTDNHTGLDFVAPSGTAVKAAASGTVTFAGWHAYGGGNRIEVTHSNGVVTTYNHLSAIDVTVGQQVTAGTAIGKVGSTGNSTGPHLHFEVIQNGAWTDPAVWLGL